MAALDNPPPSPPDAILEAALYAGDLDAAEAFYGGVLGLSRIVRAGDRHVFYRVGQMILLIFNPAATELASGDEAFAAPPHGARGPGHLCFAATAVQITAWRDALNAAGHPVEADFHWPNGARSIYFRDPAGNSLEMAEPRLWQP